MSHFLIVNRMICHKVDLLYNPSYVIPIKYLFTPTLPVAIMSPDTDDLVIRYRPVGAFHGRSISP